LTLNYTYLRAVFAPSATSLPLANCHRHIGQCGMSSKHRPLDAGPTPARRSRLFFRTEPPLAPKWIDYGRAVISLTVNVINALSRLLADVSFDPGTTTSLVQLKELGPRDPTRCYDGRRHKFVEIISWDLLRDLVCAGPDPHHPHRRRLEKFRFKKIGSIGTSSSCQSQLWRTSGRAAEGRFVQLESLGVSRGSREWAYDGISPTDTVPHEFLQKRHRHPLSG